MTDKKPLYYTIFTTIGIALDYVGLDPLVIIILTLTFILDFLTGMLKAYTFGEYKSRIGWVRTIAKVLGMGLIGCIALVLKLVGMPYTIFVTSSFMILACHDLISATSNIYAIRTGQKLEEFDAISVLIKALHSKLIAIVKKLMP
jgi:phage-related holin